MAEPVDITRKRDQEQTGAPILLLRLKRRILARYPLDKPIVTLGRSSKCDIVLDDSSGVSRKHAHIHVAADEVMLEDLGSRNGTFVNSKLAQKRTLRPGDRIAIGDYRLHFLQAPRQAAEEASPGNPITELMRRWRGAAVTADRAGCPLCGEKRHADRQEKSADSETGEHAHTVEGRPGGYTGLSAEMVADAEPISDTSMELDPDEALAFQPGDELDFVETTEMAGEPNAGLTCDEELDFSDSDLSGIDEMELAGEAAAGLADAAADPGIQVDNFPDVSIVQAYGRDDDEQDEIMEKVARLVDQQDDEPAAAEPSAEAAKPAGRLPSLRARLRRKRKPKRSLRFKR